jgi:ribonucleotide reductase alpha subunit
MKRSKGLSQSFLRQYKEREVPWGQLGYVTYKRTYARMTEKGKLEEWHETCARVCRGLLEIGGVFTSRELELLYDSMFNLYGTVSGRALWQLGTETVQEVGADSLQNCWVVACNKLSAFSFTFNQLMLGGGVGFNILPEYVYELPKVSHNPVVERVDSWDCDFIVPDNREGWVELLERVLDSFFVNGKNLFYCTRAIRPAGQKIKRFGGVASGSETLVWGITRTIEIIRNRHGEKLRPIDCLDIMNIIGVIVRSGNVRRSSEIGMGDPEDRLFIMAKNWAKQNIPDWRTMSNNSIALDYYDELQNDDFWEGYRGKGEPYGFVNLRNCREFGRIIDGRGDHDPGVVGLNPCVVGETKVMIPNGFVRIDQMIDQLVYCEDGNGELTLKMARNPRITGYNVPVVKVTFDNGESLRVTPNHKFSTGVEARNLIPGESLTILTRYTPEECLGNSYGDKYVTLSFKGNSSTAEHVELAKAIYNVDDLTGKHVHHLDGDRLNNAEDNLIIKDSTLHLSDHSEGSSNPRFSGHTYQDLITYGAHLCRQLGRRFSTKEWETFAIDNGLPTAFSDYRKNKFGEVSDFAELCSMEADVPYNASPQTLRTLLKMQNLGYSARILNGKVHVIKTCEACCCEFEINQAQREQACCGFSCANTLRDRTKFNETLKETNAIKHEIVRREQCEVYLSLNSELRRAPKKKEWQEACRSIGVSPEISRKSSPFKSYADLQYFAPRQNHKVVSVEEDGTADVWNVTVDDYHNLFYGCWNEGLTPKGRRRLVGIGSRQCGETPNEDREPCNLGEIFISRLDDFRHACQVAGILFKACKTIANWHFHDTITQEVVSRNYRTGISLTGFMECDWIRDPKQLDALYQHIKSVDFEYSRLLNIPMSRKRTTIKPSGTLSLLAGVSPGMHAVLSRHIMRTMRMPSGNPLVDVCREHGYKVEPRIGIDGSHDLSTMVVYFPVKHSNQAILTQNMDVIQELMMQQLLQTYWADNAVSATHYYQPNDIECIQKWLQTNYDNSIKSTSFLLETGHGFIQAPINPITEEEYHKQIAKVKPITCVNIQEENTDYDIELECAGGVCTVR